MKFKIFLLLTLLLISACSSKDEKKLIEIKEKEIDLQLLEAYKEGLEALDGGDVLFAAKKFNEAEDVFPQSDWAPKSALMASYAYYSQDYYFDAEEELKRFIRKYPTYKDIDYAYYLLAITYYEQIVDEKKDLESIKNAKETFELIIKNFPDTDYALDSKFKLDLIRDTLAAKEMYIGRYYLNKKKWIAAINRFKTVVEIYDTTIFIEEALHRLVETYYILGLEGEAEKYANLLGYNYLSSRWYEQSYKILNNDYQFRQIKKNKKENIIKRKFKSIFE
ncbi:outer membrane protein assembly factor BamD [Candidatus Pelagibacter sp.]|uniref:outer membrane protein assembly factor BamD n=1 Tax=Candidatus Pelagibacter sp. TaxID=2024849 RepID=UPI003F8800E3